MPDTKNVPALVDNSALQLEMAGALKQLGTHVQAEMAQALAKQVAEQHTLAQGVAAVISGLQQQVTEMVDGIDKRPYRGLLEYHLHDALHFYGRDQAVRSFLTLLSQPKEQNLIILYAESGAGKSSLIQAGVMPQLVAHGHLPLRLRPYDLDPTLAIKRHFLPDLPEHTPAETDIPQLSAPEQEFQNRILAFLRRSFDRTEIKDICFYLGINFQDLAGEDTGLSEITRRLVTYLYRQGRLPDLLQHMYQLRPRLPQIEVPESYLYATTVGLSDLPLRPFLQRVTQLIGLDTTLYIFLDQFEEFFTHLMAEKQSLFIRDLADCLADANLRTQFILALRTEYFGNLAQFRPRIRNPFTNDYRLNRLTYKEAEIAVTAPLLPYHITFAEGLVETLLTDLEESEGIAPPQLQLVCAALYEGLGEGVTTISKAQYTTDEGAAGILRSYLDRVLTRRFPPAQRSIAIDLLGSLVTSDMHRQIRSKDDLIGDLKQHSVSGETIDEILDQFVDSHLIRVREIDGRSPPGYELTHDYLVGQITLTPETKARKAAAELLAREVLTYRQFHALMRPQTVQIISAQRHTLTLDDEARTLILRSALAYDVDLAAWLIDASREQAQQTLLDGLASEDTAVSVRAIQHLNNYYDESVEKQLMQLVANSSIHDERQAALDVIAEHRPDQVRAILLADLAHPAAERRRQAAAALQPYLSTEVAAQLFHCLATEAEVTVWQEALTTLASDAAQPYRNEWKPLRHVPFARKTAVYDSLKQHHAYLPPRVAAQFMLARLLRYTQNEARTRPIWLIVRLLIPLLLYAGLAWQWHWWPFLSWEAVAGTPAESISALAQTPDGLYVGSYNYGVGFLSDDGQWSGWYRANLPTSAPGKVTDPNSDVRAIEALVAAPDDPTEVYAYIRKTGMWRSTSAAQKWDPIGTGEVYTDSLKPGLDMYNEQLLLATSVGLYASSNRGERWQNLSGEGELPQEGFYTVKFSPSGIPYVGAVDGLYQGQGEFPWTWERISGVPPVSYIAFDATNPQRLFLALGWPETTSAACYEVGKGLGKPATFGANFIRALTANPYTTETFYVSVVLEQVYEVTCAGTVHDLGSVPYTPQAEELSIRTFQGDPVLLQGNWSGLYIRKVD